MAGVMVVWALEVCTIARRRKEFGRELCRRAHEEIAGCLCTMRDESDAMRDASRETEECRLEDAWPCDDRRTEAMVDATVDAV